MNRRNFLVGCSATILASLLNYQWPRSILNHHLNFNSNDLPNILILVFDTLSAPHMSLYGYPRETTPNLDRFAERCSVFHAHYAAGNFTTPGTASILTGTYPWLHRAFNFAGTLDRIYRDQNLFQAFAGTQYFKIAYSHNLLANSILNQMNEYIDLQIQPGSFSLKNGRIINQLFMHDTDIATRAIDNLMFTNSELPGSLFLSITDRLRLKFLNTQANRPNLIEFPYGLPELFKLSFRLEDVIDGVLNVIDQAPTPFLAYVHLLPPHEPYRPHRDFVGIFDDGWTLNAKESKYFSNGITETTLNSLRNQYDEYLAYADHEFGRAIRVLEDCGRLEDTIIIFTSDHGQLIERGIHGHITQTLYDPLIRVPLLISLPGQSVRRDIYAPSSCVDLVPTLLSNIGQEIPEWCSGTVLPLIDDLNLNDRRIFVLEAKQNPKWAPLTIGTAAMIDGNHKLIYYFGYKNLMGGVELFDLKEDRNEREDLATKKPRLASELKSELMNSLPIY